MEDVIEIEHADVLPFRDDDDERTYWQRFRSFVGKYNVSLTIAICTMAIGGGYLWTTLPAPYGMRYRINMLTKEKSFQCVDGTYSFAARSRGSCSGHRGIAQDFRSEDEQDEDDE